MKTLIFSLLLMCTSFLIKPNNMSNATDKRGACDLHISHLTIQKRTADSLFFSFKVDKPNVLRATSIETQAWLSDNAKDKQVSILKGMVRFVSDSIIKVSVRAASTQKKYLIVAFKVMNPMPCMDNPNNNEVAIPFACMDVERMEAHIKILENAWRTTVDMVLKAKLAIDIRTQTAILNNLKRQCGMPM